MARLQTLPAFCFLTVLWIAVGRASGLTNEGSGFRVNVLVTNQPARAGMGSGWGEPMSLALTENGSFLFIERGGAVKWWDSSNQTTSIAAFIPVCSIGEEGLNGLALDPGFATNGWVYLHRSLPETLNRNGHRIGHTRVSRFSFHYGRLDTEHETTVIEMETQRDQIFHLAGALEFDDDGNLFVATGDNTMPFLCDGYSPLDERPGREAFDAQRTAANSASLLGKILRLKPLPGGGYSIPPGNLFPPGTPKTCPEIFVMGVRNPYRMAWDRVGKRLYWGEPGPDAVLPSRQHGPAGMDEINQTTGPGNFGWPYFCGSNLAYPHFSFSGTNSRPPEVATAPENLSPNNTGIQSLPPAQPAFLSYGHVPSKDFPMLNGPGGPTALAGPIYRYDPQLQSPYKLPKSLDHHLFIFDWNRNWIITAPLDADERLKLGPDGKPILKTRPRLADSRYARLAPATVRRPARKRIH